MKIGRNDPCLCGSGKKYKRCCLVKDQAASVLDSEWLKLRRTEGEVVHLLLQVAHEWYGDNFLADAWKEYTDVSEEPVTIDGAPEADTSFIPWSVFTFVPSNGEASLTKLPVALSYLFTAADLDPYEKQFIVDMCEQPYSFWAVQEVEPGTSLKLQDIFTKTEYTVKERQASDVLKKGDILFTRVISLGRTAIMVGLAPFPFPPRFHFDVLNARELFFGARQMIAPEELHPFEPLLRQLYFKLRHSLLNPAMPVLQNTDGDPLEFITLTYQLGCSPRTAFDKLRALNPLESEEALLSDSETDENGVLRQVDFSWMKKGNKQHRSWENTILGHIVIENEQLVVEVNSTKRSRKIQTEIAKRLGESAVLLDTIAESAAHMLAEAQAGEETEAQRQVREEQAALTAVPEVQAQMKEMAQQRWEEWLDEPVPLLLGKTPRQAARSVAARDRLEALLVDFERQGAAGGNPAFAPDVAELRRQLRMLPGAVRPRAERTRKQRPALEDSQLDGVTLYQLKITLKRSDPPIWRRIVVRSDIPLNRLHGVIQRVMGWTDSHLHHFFVGRTFYGTPDPDMMDFGPRTLNEKRYTVAHLAPVAKKKFVYEYDFGDSWEHEIVVEKVLPPDPAFRHPVCLAGANACPPEDCGGLGSYYDLLEVLSDPKHPEHTDIKEWLGYDLDPARFDLESVNAMLNRLKA